MNLPAAVSTYFTARAPEDGAAFAAAFAPEAIVHDEGQRHQGGPAIRDWWLAAKARYRHEAVPLEVSEQDGKTRVRARVTGDFPGSPAVLTFAFGLRDGRIADLAIG
ncbi:nuclear transport factor 2 family protein [Pararhodobacter aggregans]|uniref:SnoaL-like domain-containing protein n=1 Tax=Pararhodobacter aggregans TaxID=404875 RepID=A0A2T7UPA9_9RHOB|nr:nuclear transport factor 2 family protein [Pararhodobacter aggregans]PTX01093.1 SnoaL-like protein [Pararhodobacter aggregans]PVE46486.1 hypothetical protein DDE23_15135 [Pararhodobacter aggregans]